MSENQQAIFLRVRAAVCEALGFSPRQIEIGSQLTEELDVDPVELDWLIDELENQFGIDIMPAEAKAWRTVEDIVDFVTEQLQPA